MENLVTTKIDIDISVYKFLENNRVSFSESLNDILKRVLKIESVQPKYERRNLNESAGSEKISRNTGGYGFTLKGKFYQFSNMKTAYMRILTTLSALNSNFLQKLSLEETPARRLVAKRKFDLYKKNPHLSEEFAEELVEGWWVDVNLSQQQVESRVEKNICKVAELKYGLDLKLSFPEIRKPKTDTQNMSPEEILESLGL